MVPLPSSSLPSLLLLLLLPSLHPYPSGLSLSFTSRPTPSSPGEVRTTPFLSPTSSFSYTLKFRFSSLSAVTQKSKGSVDFYGHLFGLETSDNTLLAR